MFENHSDLLEFLKQIYAEFKNAENKNISALQEIEDVDWNVKDVLVGSVSSEEQYVHNLANNYYYVPAEQVDLSHFPISYVAIYSSKRSGTPGINYYGKVISTHKVKRLEIPYNQEVNRNNDKLYYRFDVEKWSKLEKPIVFCDESVYGARFTNFFLLTHCKKTYELFNINSKDDYKLFSELTRYLNSTKVVNDEELFVELSDEYSLWGSDGYLKIINSEENIVASFALRDFKHRPNAFMKKIVKYLKKH